MIIVAFGYVSVTSEIDFDQLCISVRSGCIYKIFYSDSACQNVHDLIRVRRSLDIV